MNHFESVWNSITPILFAAVLILEVIFTIRITQKMCRKILIKISNELKSLYKGNGMPLAKSEQGCSSFIQYTSTFIGGFLGIVITGFLIGAFMIFSVSSLFSNLNLSIFPSFINSIFEWIILFLSAILLFFMGLYASRLISYYLHKLPSPHAHTYAQCSSLGLLGIFIFMSFSKIGSAIQFINLSFLIVTISVLVALLLPFFKAQNLTPNLKSLLHKIV